VIADVVHLYLSLLRYTTLVIVVRSFAFYACSPIDRCSYCDVCHRYSPTRYTPRTFAIYYCVSAHFLRGAQFWCTGYVYAIVTCHVVVAALPIVPFRRYVVDVAIDVVRAFIPPAFCYDRCLLRSTRAVPRCYVVAMPCSTAVVVDRCSDRFATVTCHLLRAVTHSLRSIVLHLMLFTTIIYWSDVHRLSRVMRCVLRAVLFRYAFAFLRCHRCAFTFVATCTLHCCSR